MSGAPEAMISAVPGDELRARERRALNGITLDELLARAPDEPADFACECGDLGCRARVQLVPSELAAFRRSFSAFVVAPGHQISPSASMASATRSNPTMFAPAAKSPGRP